MNRILIFAALLTLAACKPTVNPNEWVVSTTTCWNTMTVTKAGSPLPRLYTACDRMVILPATEMSADLTCDTKFKGRVAARVNISYQWRISDPVQFIQSAKSITSSSTDEHYKVNPDFLEAVENAVVDKMIIDLVRDYTPTLDAGVDEASVEIGLAERTKSRFAARGVEFSNMSVNIDFTPQTEEALDVISALEFYKSNGEEALGRDVIKAKASAPRIVVEQVKEETQATHE